MSIKHACLEERKGGREGGAGQSRSDAVEVRWGGREKKRWKLVHLIWNTFCPTHFLPLYGTPSSLVSSREIETPGTDLQNLLFNPVLPYFLSFTTAHNSARHTIFFSDVVCMYTTVRWPNIYQMHILKSNKNKRTAMLSTTWRLTNSLLTLQLNRSSLSLTSSMTLATKLIIQLPILFLLFVLLLLLLFSFLLYSLTNLEKEIHYI